MAYRAGISTSPTSFHCLFENSSSPIQLLQFNGFQYIKYNKYSVYKCEPNPRLGNLNRSNYYHWFEMQIVFSFFLSRLIPLNSIPFAILILFVKENVNCSGTLILLLFLFYFRAQAQKPLSYDCEMANNNNNNNSEQN